MYSFSSWLSCCSSSFAGTTYTFKTVRLNFISCCFESKGLRTCWSFWADVGLADASSVKLADGKVDAWYDSCLGSKQRSSSPVAKAAVASFCAGTESQFRKLEWLFSCSRGLSLLSPYEAFPARTQKKKKKKKSAWQTFTILVAKSNAITRRKVAKRFPPYSTFTRKAISFACCETCKIPREWMDLSLTSPPLAILLFWLTGLLYS